MASTIVSEPKERTRGIRCGGSHPRKRDEPCDQLLVAVEGTCPRCGKPYTLNDLLREAIEKEYIAVELHGDNYIEEGGHRMSREEIDALLAQIQKLSDEERKELAEAMKPLLEGVDIPMPFTVSQKEFLQKLIAETRAGKIVWHFDGSRGTGSGDGWSDEETLFSVTVNGFSLTYRLDSGWASMVGCWGEHELRITHEGETAIIKDPETGWFTPHLVRELSEVIFKIYRDQHQQAQNTKTEQNHQMGLQFIQKLFPRIGGKS